MELLQGSLSDMKAKLQDPADSSLIIAHNHLDPFGRHHMSKEEQEIREELEAEIERNMEEEIKAGICRLALQLHRLQQKNKAKSKQPSANLLQSQVTNKKSTAAEVTIKMEGGCKIAIYEHIPKGHGRGVHSGTRKHSDWPGTLQSGTSSAMAVGRRNAVLDKVLKNKRNASPTAGRFGREGRKCYDGSNQNCKSFGWKY